MKTAVVVFPGSNRDADMVRALTELMGAPPAIVWYQDTALPDVDMVAIPGGFSYGDYLRAGAIAARAPIMRAIAAHAETGRLVLGVCNGFQILCEAGLLPGVLMRNADQHFICRHTFLRVETTRTPFTSAYAKGQIIRSPVAHGEGNYRCSDETLAELEGDDRVVFRYADALGHVDDTTNINGSVAGIAGIVSARRNVLGMMPHPENLIEDLHGGTDGRALFRSMAESLAEAA